jgi:hypothetical protein
MESFDLLPFETKLEILRNLPNFRRLNKDYYEKGKNIFIEDYCNLEITNKEFINYIKKYEPDYFCLFINKNTKFICYVFDTWGESGEQLYNVQEYILEIDNIDINEYVINSDVLELRSRNMSKVITLIEKIIDNNNNNKIYYDIKSVYHIILDRQCNNAIIYANQYIKYIFNDNCMTSDLYRLFHLIKKIWYMSFSENILLNNIIEYEYLYGNDVNNIIFDSYGETEYDIEDIINLLVNNLNSYNIIL